MNNSKKKGFSLIELSVVIAVIVVLTAMVLIFSNNTRLKSRDARRLSDIRAMRTAVEIYKKSSVDDTVPAPASWSELSAVLSTELSVVPHDPSNSSANHYVYCYYKSPTDSSNKGKYVFAVALEQAVDILSDIDAATSTITCVGSDNSSTTGINCDDSSGNLNGELPQSSHVYCASNTAL